MHGASGGVGMAAVQLGKLYGAKVIATGTSDEKLEVVKSWGADEVLNIYENEKVNFRDRVKDLTNGMGADVIYDPVGGEVFDQSIRCINWGGRLLIIGFAGGTIPTLPVNYPLIKGFISTCFQYKPDDVGAFACIYFACPHLLRPSVTGLNGLNNSDYEACFLKDAKNFLLAPLIEKILKEKPANPSEYLSNQFSKKDWPSSIYESISKNGWPSFLEKLDS